MCGLFLTFVFLCLSQTVLSVYIFKLGYRVTPEQSLKAPDYDGLVFIASQPLNDSTIPQPIKDALIKAPKVNGELNKDGSVLEVNLPASRMIFVPTGPISDFADARRFREAANKAIQKVLEAKMQTPLLVLHPDPNPKFPHAELVTLLGLMELLYVNIQQREKCPDGCRKIKYLGVWGPEYSTVIDIVNMAANFEDGRIVARDISDADPDRMSPPKVEEYVREVFTPESGVNISVVSDPQELQRQFPLFSTVSRAASGADSHAGRIIFLTYATSLPIVDTLLLVGKGITYDTGGSDVKSSRSQDRAGAAAVAGFMKILSDTRVGGLKVVAAMALTPNSVGENCFASDEVIRARSGKRVRIVNTDSEGKMVLADILSYMKELVEKKEAAENPHIISVATLSDERKNVARSSYGLITENGPSAKCDELVTQTLQMNSLKIGEPLELTVLQKEDLEASKGDDLVQGKDGQGPAAFLVMASGLDKHGLDSPLPIKYSHVEVTGSGGPGSSGSAAAPVLSLANRFILRLEDPAIEGYH